MTSDSQHESATESDSTRWRVDERTNAREHWDEKSKTYHQKYDSPETVFEFEKRDRLQNALSLSKIPPEGVLIDIGVGSGELLHQVRRDNLSCVGVDIAAEMLRLAKNRVTEAENTHATVDQLPFDDETVDVAFALGVVGYLDSDHLATAISEMARILVPGGQLILSFANQRSPFRRLRAVYAATLGEPDEMYSTYDPEYFLDVINTAGLRVEQRRYLTFTPALLDGPIERYLYQFGERWLSTRPRIGPLGMTWLLDVRK